MSQIRATSAVPPNFSIMDDAFMSYIIGFPNDDCKDILTPNALAFMTMDTFYERLISAREAKGISQADLYRAVGVSNATVSEWESGKTKPRGSNLLKVSKVLGVNPEWLSSGKGPRHSARPSLMVAGVDIYDAVQDPEIQQLIVGYLRLSEYGRQSVSVAMALDAGVRARGTIPPVSDDIIAPVRADKGKSA